MDRRARLRVDERSRGRADQAADDIGDRSDRGAVDPAVQGGVEDQAGAVRRNRLLGAVLDLPPGAGDVPDAHVGDLAVEVVMFVVVVHHADAQIVALREIDGAADRLAGHFLAVDENARRRAVIGGGDMAPFVQADGVGRGVDDLNDAVHDEGEAQHAVGRVVVRKVQAVAAVPDHVGIEQITDDAVPRAVDRGRLDPGFQRQVPGNLEHGVLTEREGVVADVAFRSVEGDRAGQHVRADEDRRGIDEMRAADERAVGQALIVLVALIVVERAVKREGIDQGRR